MKTQNAIFGMVMLLLCSGMSWAYLSVQFDSPSANSTALTNSRDIPMKGIVDTNETLVNVTLQLFNSIGLVADRIGADDTLYVLWSNWADETYYFNITALSAEGTFNYSETRNLTIDGTPPAIEFLGGTVNDSAVIKVNHIQYNVSGDDTHWLGYEVYVFNDTTDVEYSASAPQKSIFDNSSALPDGSHHLVAYAYDSAGNTNLTEDRHIITDTENPTVVFDTPSVNDSDIITGTGYNVSISAIDNYLVHGVSIYIYNSTGDNIDSCLFSNSSPTESLSCGFTVLQGNQDYSVQGEAVDVAGNSNLTEVRNFTVNYTAPIPPPPPLPPSAVASLVIQLIIPILLISVVVVGLLVSAGFSHEAIMGVMSIIGLIAILVIAAGIVGGLI
jgi:hypothetical protein